MADQATPRASRSFHSVALGGVRRLWRGLRRRLRGHNVQFVYHEDYERSLGTVPLDPKRAEKILSFLAEEGLIERDDIRVPWPPQMRALLRVHDVDYLESLQRPEEVTRIFGTPVSHAELENVIEMHRMMIGGTIFATKMAVRDGGVVFNLGGGFHHALRDSGMGFCLVNDIAVAIARLRSRGFSDRILVVDLDMHDGNGTRAIFARDQSVHTYSVHADHWGDTKAVESTSIALGNEVGDELLLGTILKTLPEVVNSANPGLVIYLAGTDPAADDEIGSWHMSSQGMLRRDQLVMRLVRDLRRDVPVVVVLGGGYGIRSWRYTARFVGWLMTGRRLRPPVSEQLMLDRFRRIKQQLEPSAMISEPDQSSWRITEEDLTGVVPQAARDMLFLGYFSRHGLELVLERFGILDQLRVRGYKHPVVEVDLEHPIGHVLRIFGAADREQLLVELRVNRSRRVVPECEVLVVEWLLLQNPGSHFGPYRRQLPGQSHPGLGMLKDVFGWLVVVCELLELDGIYYLPSSYHVAAQSRHLVRFLKPEHEARYRAFMEALGDLPLAEASQAVSQNRVVDASTGGPVEWQGFPMVLPVSDELEDRVYGSGYEASVAEEIRKLDFRFSVAPEDGR
jgi:acetoin utilization deacetylase AcuC-like enzyme